MSTNSATPVSEISVVACLKATEDSSVAGIDCEMNCGVTVKYLSAEYKVTYYEAKTAKKISEGTPINSPAASCPMFLTYERDTKKAYATPDNKALEATLDTFVR